MCIAVTRMAESKGCCDDDLNWRRHRPGVVVVVAAPGEPTRPQPLPLQFLDRRRSKRRAIARLLAVSLLVMGILLRPTGDRSSSSRGSRSRASPNLVSGTTSGTTSSTIRAERGGDSLLARHAHLNLNTYAGAFARVRVLRGGDGNSGAISSNVTRERLMNATAGLSSSAAPAEAQSSVVGGPVEVERSRNSTETEKAAQETEKAAHETEKAAHETPAEEAPEIEFTHVTTVAGTGSLPTRFPPPEQP